MDLGYWVKVGDAGWRHVSPKPTDHDVDAAQLIADAPEFLSVLEPGSTVPMAVVPAPGSTSGRVSIAVSEQGRVRLVVCPEQGGNEEVSALAGDVLAVGGRFWHQPFKAFAAPFAEKLGKPLDEWFAERAGKEWSKQEFKAAVEKSLEYGRFPVAMVARKLDEPLKEMVGYLQNMTLKVHAVGYACFRAEGVEIVRPVPLGKPVREKTPSGADYRMGQVSSAERHTETVTISTKNREKREPEEYEPFPDDEASDEQKRILARLVRLDELGLVRKGFEYFVPVHVGKDGAEGAVVVSVDEERWPFPKEGEVVVVVNTSHDYLAGYLNLSSEEIEEFLDSLPRVQRKEHKGCLLLRASNIHEADQLVNEMRALREVAETGV